MAKKFCDIVALSSTSSGRKFLTVNLQKIKKSELKKQLRIIKQLKVDCITVTKYRGKKTKFIQYSRLTPKSKCSKVKHDNRESYKTNRI